MEFLKKSQFLDRCVAAKAQKLSESLRAFLQQLHTSWIPELEEIHLYKNSKVQIGQSPKFNLKEKEWLLQIGYY